MTSPIGAQIHFSSDKCNDFSCRDQSYLFLNRSQQKVHWNSLGAASISTLGVRVGSRRRRRLSFDFRLFREPNELREPCDQAELCDPEEMFVNPVSKEVVDGARKAEKLLVLSFELPFL